MREVIHTKARNAIREVYFIRAFELGLIKIGVTNDTRRRLASLQTFSPDTLYVMGVQLCFQGGVLETALHARFAEYRQHGEWFWPGRKLLDHIDAHTMTLDEAVAERMAVEASPEITAAVQKAADRRRSRWMAANGFSHLMDEAP